MQERLENADNQEQAIHRKLDLQNAKLAKENAQKALVKAQEEQEEAKQKKKKKAIKKKIIDEKIDQNNETQDEITERKADKLRARAKKMKYKEKSGPEPEVIEAIKKGKKKGIENVFNDDVVTADKTEPEEQPEINIKSFKKFKKSADSDNEDTSMKIDEDYTDSGKKIKKKADDAELETSATSSKKSADEAEPESLGEVKAQKMKDYFKKSQVYQNYQQE